MKVLIINTFAEGTSTAKIAVGLYQKLKSNGHECRILYGAGNENENPDFIKIATDLDIKLSWIHNQITGVHGNFAPMVIKRVYKIIEDFKPDIVQLYNLHFYYLDIYKLFAYLKKRNIATVYGMLDEYPYMGYCCYPYECTGFQSGCMECNKARFRKEYPRNIFRNGAVKTLKLKQESYEGFEKLIFTGPEFVVNRAKQSFLLRDKQIEILDEYVENEYTFTPKDTKELCKELKIDENQVVILNVAPSGEPRKGVSDFINVAKRLENNNKFVFVNVGFQGDTSNLPKNFIPISFVKNQEKLAGFYSMADLLVCTSYADTMPNVCLDALSCGTSVLGYQISGIPYVAQEPYGHYLETSNVDAMCDFILRVKKKSSAEAEQCRQYALKRYSPQAYYEKTMKIYNRLYDL